jgi:hypothetical protein
MNQVGRRFWVLGTALFLAASMGSVSTVWAEEDNWEAEAAKIHTADCNPVDTGKLESYVGFESARSKKGWDAEGHEGDRGGTCKERHLLLGLTYGLVKNLDLGLSTGCDYCDDDLSPVCAKGLNDLSVASKWKVFCKGGLGLALLPSLVLPVGTRDNMSHLGTTQLFCSAGLGAAVVQSWNHLVINADGGYSLLFGGDRGDERGTFACNGAVGYQILRILQPEVELNYSAESEKDVDAAKSLALTAGVLFPTGKYGRFELGVQPTLRGRSVDKGTSYHFAWVMDWL